MSDKIELFRRRYIPNELTWLKDDEIIAYNDERIVTHWHTLKPRPDFSEGYSTYYRKKGIKVSKIIDNTGNFLHWYCDIVAEKDRTGLNVDSSCRLRNESDRYILFGNAKRDNVIVYEDLLVDVIVNPNGLIEVSDLDELADAYEKGQITKEMLTKALHTTHDYLALLYSRVGKIDCSDERFVMP